MANAEFTTDAQSIQLGKHGMPSIFRVLTPTRDFNNTVAFFAEAMGFEMEAQALHSRSSTSREFSEHEYSCRRSGTDHHGKLRKTRVPQSR